VARLGCDAPTIIDEFGEKLLEELDYKQEARNMADFGANFRADPSVKIPAAFPALSSGRVLTMEWIDGIRCTDPAGIAAAGIDVQQFIRVGVVSGLRQLLEHGLFHGDPHPGNVFALRDGRIAYVDFGNVAQLGQRNKEVLVDAVVHAVNEDYEAMAGDFIQLGFLQPGTDLRPIVPALERIWSDARTRSLSNFNFRSVTSAFNALVYQYPIRIPERFSLVIRSLLTQEGICMTLSPEFRFLQVAYPYVAKRLLTSSDSSLRDRLIQVLFKGGQFQLARLENLVTLAGGEGQEGLDLSDTMVDGARVFLLDDELRTKLLAALTADDRLATAEVASLVATLQRTGSVQPERLLQRMLDDAPAAARSAALAWSRRVLAA
jgi:predicted unusual protein kinase regulating ubiquinone biosynthesis (AarF/ABC1/UbiB family)